MKVTGSNRIARSPEISSKPNKTLEAKAKAAVVKELKAKNPGVTHIRVSIPKFEGAAGSSNKATFEHYGFMTVHVTGQLPSGKKIEANPSYSGQSGTMIWR